MLPPDQSNVDYILGLTRRVDALEAQLREFQLMFSALCLMAMDDKGKVRINKQILNRTGKIAEILYDTNARGAIIATVTMQEKA